MQIEASPRARASRLVVTTPNFEAEILAGSPVVARVAGRGALSAIELPVLSVADPARLAELLSGLEAIVAALGGRRCRALILAALEAAAAPAEDA